MYWVTRIGWRPRLTSLVSSSPKSLCQGGMPLQPSGGENSKPNQESMWGFLYGACLSSEATVIAVPISWILSAISVMRSK